MCVLAFYVQAWRCVQATAMVAQLREALPHRTAQRNWQRAVATVQEALRRQRLEAERQKLAATAIQSAVRGWQVRRVVAKQLAGIRRFQVGAG